MISMCKDLRNWVNHSKEGYPRQEEDLKHFDILWNSIDEVIMKLQMQAVLHDEEERDLLRLIKYEGVLYRIHKKYKIRAANYGVKETDHYVSWTKTTNFSDLYWLYKESDFITITANTTPELYGIDLVGFSEYIQKYFYSNFSIGSPAIIKEQEVVFPVKLSTILDITPKKWIEKV